MPDTPLTEQQLDDIDAWTKALLGPGLAAEQHLFASLVAEVRHHRAQAALTPCICRQAVHAREHTNRPVTDCPWCTPTPTIRASKEA